MKKKRVVLSIRPNEQLLAFLRKANFLDNNNRRTSKNFNSFAVEALLEKFKAPAKSQKNAILSKMLNNRKEMDRIEQEQEFLAKQLSEFKDE